MGERNGKGHPPLHPERQRSDEFVFGFTDARRQDRTANSKSCGREVPILSHRQVVVESERLRHVSHSTTPSPRRSPGEQPCAAAGRTQQSEQNSDERRLAGTVCSK